MRHSKPANWMELMRNMHRKGLAALAAVVGGIIGIAATAHQSEAKSAKEETCGVWRQAYHGSLFHADSHIHSWWDAETPLPAPVGYWLTDDPDARQPDNEHAGWVSGKASDEHDSCIDNG
jgi:hypothetical protein